MEITEPNGANGDEYEKILAEAKSFLPFLKTILKTDDLGIPEENKLKLQVLYDMVDHKRLEKPRLKSTLGVMHSLYKKYNNTLTKKDEEKVVINSSNQLNEGENKTKFPELSLTSDLSGPSSKSEHSSKMSASSAIKNKKNTSLNNHLDNLKHECNPNNNPVIGDISKNDESISIKSLKRDDFILGQNNLPEFSESRLRLNKVIGFATNASIEKLNSSDSSFSHSEIAQQVYDDLMKKTTKPAYCHNMLSGINIDNIDVTDIKKVIEDLKRTSVEPVEPPPLPPSDLMNLGAANLKIVSSIEQKVDHVPKENTKSIPNDSQLITSLVPCKTTLSVREKLSTEINVVHKIGPSNESKPKLISALKPGTLIDLENSKGNRIPLHMEPVNSVLKINEKITDTQQLANVPDLVLRDPRIRNKSLLNPVSNINLIQSPLQTNVQQPITAPKLQNSGSTYMPHLLSSNLSPGSISSTFVDYNPQETSQHLGPMNNLKNIGSQPELSQAFSGYNGPSNFRSLSGYTNMSQISAQLNGNPSQGQNCRSSTQKPCVQNRNDLNFDILRKDFGQYSSSNQTHVNRMHNETTNRYSEQGSSYNHVSNRDPRSIKNDQMMLEPRYRSYKEFREAKYGKEKNSNNGSRKTKNEKINQEHDHSRSLESDKSKHLIKLKSDTLNSNPYNSFGVINDTANIKNFKIPKIKRKEETFTEKCDETNTEKKLKTEIIKPNDIEKDLESEKIKNNIIDKNLETGTSKNISKKKDSKYETKDKILKTETTKIINKNKASKSETIDKILKTETNKNSIGNNLKTINKEKDSVTEQILDHTEKDSKSVVKSNEMSSKDLAINNQSNINKNEAIIIEMKPNHFSEESKKESYKPKKPKKYSKEKEFEKIVKEAVESLNSDNKSGPRTRTRSSLKKKEDPLKNNSNDSRKKGIKSDGEKKDKVECRTNLVNKSLPSTENNSDGLIETGLNIISSTSKEPSEVNSSVDDGIKISNENIVSSNEINSTADTTSKPKIDQKDLIKLLENPKLLSMINILQDEEKMEKLQKLLESPVVEDIIENKPMNKNELNYKHSDVNEQKKMKRDKKKGLKKSTLHKISSIECKNKLINSISDDDNLNNECLAKTNDGESYLINSDDEESTSSGNDSDQLSVGKIKSKSIKYKKSNDNYRSFEILKDKHTQIKDLKIVIAKFDKDINGSDFPISDDSKTNVGIKNETKLKLKSKKPFLGPLSVKLARQKLEERNSQNEINEKTHLKSDASSSTVNSIDVKKLSCSEPCVILESESAKSSKASEEILPQNQFSLEERSTTKTDLIETNNIDSIESVHHSTKSKKKQKNELDRLHASISEMYDVNQVLNAPNIRHCRTNKQIDYVNYSHVVSSKKSKASQLDCNDQNNEYICDVRKSKVIKGKMGKKLNYKLKRKHTMPNSTVKTVVKNNKPNALSNKINSKRKVKSKKISELINISNSCEISQKNIESVTLKTKKVVSENEFKDKLYFQMADNILECKFCHYSDTGLNIVNHYKVTHFEEEVLPSRLAKNCADILINESLKENFGYHNTDKNEDLKSVGCASSNIYFKCVFCKIDFNDIIQFYDHILCHTGEYRYKCKMCENVYPNEGELEKHILEHPSYDKNSGISNLLYPNPIQRTKLFGYLCSFCNYVQLDYNNIVKHMTLRHFYEDKKFNGYWTVIRISMSGGDDNVMNSSISIDYANLVGCLPPTHDEIYIEQTISKTNVDKCETTSQSSVAAELPKAKEMFEDNPELIKMIKKEVVQEVEFLSQPNLIMQSIITDQSYGNETRMVEDESEIKHSEYTLKENSIKCTVDGLSCELINDDLLFECLVPKCQFFTVDFRNFVKHIELNHQLYVWNKKCDTCKFKIEMTSEQCFLKDALQHMVSHHLVLKTNEQSNLSNLDLSNKQSLPTVHEDSLKLTNSVKANELASLSNVDFLKEQSLPAGHEDSAITEPAKKLPSILRVRNIPGDTLSTRADKSDSLDTIVPLSISGPSIEKCIELKDKTVNENITREENMVKNYDHLSHIVVDDSPFDVSVDQTNTYQVSNDNSNKILNSQSVNVLSLKERSVQKKIVPKQNLNYNDLSMWMKVKTQYEVVFSKSGVFLEPGQHTVNDGETIQGTYHLIDTEYKKNYLKKVRELPINKMKTTLAFNDMTSLPRLLGLYKCMDRTCTKIFEKKELFILHMQLHFSNTEKKKKNQTYNTEQFKMCAYCFQIFNDADSLANHINEKYSFCEYFCPYCFYRAYTPSHVLVHQSVLHNSKDKPFILKLEYSESVLENPKELLLAVDFNEFVLPYVCNVGCCKFSCWLHNDFIIHLNQDHQQCDKFNCYICADEDNIGEGFLAFQPKSMINHFKLHNINMYQCIFCLFGTEVLDSMISHLAMEHFEYQPLCLERTPITNTCDAKKIENLKIIRINKVIDNGIIETVKLPPGTSSLPEILPKRTKKRSLECPDVLSAAMKSARIDESTRSSDTIIITVPDREQMSDGTLLTPTVDNEFIMLDCVNQNDVQQETLKLNDVWIQAENNRKELQHLNDDVIIIDDDEDELLLDDNTPNTKETSAVSTNNAMIEQSTKAKRLALPLVLLDKLFTCKQCDKVFSYSKDYQTHLQEQCPFWNFNGQQCVFCPKLFKTPFYMTEHLKLHGPDRFKCTLCNLNVPSHRAITHHMKMKHNIINIDFVPVDPDSTNFDRDEFIVSGKKKTISTPNLKINYFSCKECTFNSTNRKSIISHMKNTHHIEHFDIILVDELSQNYEVRRTKSDDTLKSPFKGIKRKFNNDNFDNICNNQKSSKLKDIPFKINSISFSPETINSIPVNHIFSEPIGCSLCTYNTKVRSNLIIHLEGHKKGQDNTTKEIVNPVPSIGKSELMFDKMINLSASSFEAMNTEKMKIDEINKKIFENAPPDGLNLALFPKFVPENMRFKCFCNYTGVNDEMLKKHISVLHPDYQCYLCPHCPSVAVGEQTRVIELNKIKFHLLHHSENLYKCQYCDHIDFNRDEMRAHMRNVHASEIMNANESSIIVLRQNVLDDIVDRNRNPAAQSNMARWICNICSSSIKYTENEITSHIFMAHNVSNMFKCPMCPFNHKNDDTKIFENHYKLNHPHVAAKCLKVFDKITEIEEQQKQTKYLQETANIHEQQALESIEPTLVPPTCRGIPIETVSKTKSPTKSRVMSKSPKTTAKSSQSYKQKMLAISFSKDDSLGSLSPNGLFVCPRCNVFQTLNVEHFRLHLYKDVQFKIWKCLKCFEFSDSPKKMAWHVKKHGYGSKYEKIEDNDKYEWVERVICHQNLLLNELRKSHGNNSYEQKISIVTNKKSFPPLKKNKVVDSEDKILDSKDQCNEIINLLDDSDDE